MRQTARIIDAATNRAAEALRVMEDAARFLLDDSTLTRELKQLRHDLRATAPPTTARDTNADVGTTITTSAESTRANHRAVITAAAKRLQESLRSLEEWTKLPSPPSPLPRGEGRGEGSPPSASLSPGERAGVRASPLSSSSYESLRYRAYTLEQQLLAALPTPFTGWNLCLLLTESLCTKPWQEVAEAAIAAGADAIQLREKSLSDRELLNRARALVELAQGRADIIINDRPDIALAAGAQGVHLGQTDLPVETARALAPDLIIGVSTSNMQEANAARTADYCGLGPMFISTTKAKPTLAGPAYLHDYLAHEPQLPPALAISGITPTNLPELITAANNNTFGIAVSSYICSSHDPEESTRTLLDILLAGAEPSTLR